MFERMRTSLALALTVVVLAACQPTATVRQQSPIANLRTYRVVGIRVAGAGAGSRWTDELEAAVVQHVSKQCYFDSVVTSAQLANADADLVVDLNIQRVFRGGTGIIQNDQKATMDVLLVLSEGASEDLVGSVWIRGESPTMHISGSVPERQALEVVADSVGRVLHASGCSLARIDPEPEPEPEPNHEPVTDNVAEAERLNNEGKALVKAADIEGAVARFLAAVELAPDPRYYFNLCFSYQALKQYDAALRQCQEVLDRHPTDQLREKTKQRITRIRETKGG